LQECGSGWCKRRFARELQLHWCFTQNHSFYFSLVACGCRLRRARSAILLCKLGARNETTALRRHVLH
jgi:hypothetical protein